MKHPVWVALGMAAAAAGVAAVVRNGKPAAELTQMPDTPKRILYPVSDWMHKEFGQGRHDPIEATGD